MSRENVELAHATVDAVAQMDVARLLELTDPDVEWHSFLAQLGEGGVYRGHDGMREYVKDLRETWEVFQATVVGEIAIGDVVLLLSQLRYRGKGSGIDDAASSGHMLKFREGKIVYMRSFREPENALEAVGLSE